MRKCLNSKFTLSIVLFLSIITSIILSIEIDKSLFIENNEIAPTIQIKEVIADSEVIDKIEIKYDWQISIPRIDLIAPIKEGSDIVTLRNNVGHITGTGLSGGNIALAGHTNTANYQNGTYYFDRIDELKQGDRIYYRINNQDYVFKVEDIKVVNEKDLSVLNESERTRLTLITCIAGQHSNRLVVECVKDTDISV